MAEPTIAEIVAKLDALAEKATSSWAWGDSDMRFFAALRNAYPTLRAAALRCAELDDVCVDCFECGDSQLVRQLRVHRMRPDVSWLLCESCSAALPAREEESNG